MEKSIIIFTVFLGITYSLDDVKWNNFKNTHFKRYNDLEDKLRFKIFQDSLREIEAHNDKYNKGEVSYFLTTTQYADWTNEEFRSLLNSNFNKKLYTKTENVVFKSKAEIPPSVDWRNEKAVTEVKDEGTCGCGWAFSAVGTIEGQLVLKRNQSATSLSVQELIDCSAFNFGCTKGSNRFALMYAREFGISSDEQYPYEAKDDTCKNITDKAVKPIAQYGTVEESENSLAEAVARIGPIASVVYVDEILGWKLYGGGIFDNPSCTDSINHGILTVGYGTAEKDFWILKNSWGTTWGENGYMRLVRGKKQCGIYLDNSFAILDS
ncbi:cathepsin L-like proteinase [Diabrotica undecimpunctata]|uniref:cathepsin L-like proteinase n=1 Tax=Diabrotica undecimpunctata TaxID=50387 RepID=UPI003B635C35